MQNDCDLLEEAYHNVSELDNMEELLSEGKIDDLLNTIKGVTDNLPAFLGNLGSYFKQAALIGLGAGLASQLIGWIFIAISKMLDKDLEFEQNVRKKVAQQLQAKQSEEIDPDGLTDEELYAAYRKIETDLAETLDAQFPIKGKTRWALVLNKVGRFMKNKIGTSALAIAGLSTYFRMAETPSFGEQPIADFDSPEWQNRSKPGGGSFTPTHTIDVGTGVSAPYVPDSSY